MSNQNVSRAKEKAQVYLNAFSECILITMHLWAIGTGCSTAFEMAACPGAVVML